MLYLDQLPFTYSGQNEIHKQLHEFDDVEFTQDWGIFKKGEKYDSVDINTEDGELRAFDDEARQVAMQFIKIILTPIS